jgi:thiamine biosynthesis lipoprotein
MTSRRQPWAALGTFAQIDVERHDRHEAAMAIACQQLAGVERMTSSSQPGSDLSRANARAGSWVQVDPLFVDLVTRVKSLTRSTAGLVNPCSAAAVSALRGSATGSRPARAGHGLRGLQPSPAWPTRPSEQVQTRADGWVRVPAGNVLTLGMITRAWAADLVVERVVRELGCSVVVSIGAHVAATSLDPATAWQVRVATPEDPDGQVVAVQAGGIATARRLRMRRPMAGTTQHLAHASLDQGGAAPIRSATVCASSCVEAYVAAEAALGLGGQAASWLESRNLSALLVEHDGTTVRCARWPQPDRAVALC